MFLYVGGRSGPGVVINTDHIWRIEEGGGATVPEALYTIYTVNRIPAFVCKDSFPPVIEYVKGIFREAKVHAGVAAASSGD
jgi:hypothetical protein